MIMITELKPENAKRLAELAKPIWEEHYTPIIGAKQVEYMLNKFQSEAAVKQQIESGYEYWFVFFDKKPAGYFAIEKRATRLFISKFYLALAFRGRDIARTMLNQCKKLALNKNCPHLSLTVNKDNPAYGIYHKLGFTTLDAVKVDIGSGYFMDDYCMELKLNINN